MNPPYPILLMSQALGAGGSERQLAETARALDRSRFQPHVACFREGGIREEELRRAGVPVLLLPIRSFRSAAALSAVGALRRYVRANGIQLVHAFDAPTVFWGVPAARLLRVPAVLSSQRNLPSLRGAFRRRVMRIAGRIADGIVVNSLAVRDALIREDAVPAARIHLCYNGIDLDRFHSRRPHSAPESPVVIAFAGVLRAEKDLGTLLDAVRQLPLTEGLVRLRIIGSGPEEGALKRRCRALGLDGTCSFEPATSQVEEALRTADIFVLPSLSESFSNSLMEAMACGCAVVASRAGGNPELVAHGETGLLFDPGDSSGLAAALRSLAADSAFLERLARNAAEAIRARFSLAEAAAAMGRIYESFLAGAR